MTPRYAVSVLCVAALHAQQRPAPAHKIGREVAIQSHLEDGGEYRMTVPDLVAYGKTLFAANWTEQEGGGRPLTKGNGKELSDPSRPLTGIRAFNRFSAPDANSCAGCHNMPYGLVGGRGDFVANVFVLGQRFDFATFDPGDAIQTSGAMDERLQPASLGTFGNSRMTTSIFGGGYLEMLAREITEDLQAIRDTLAPGQSRALVSKGISFGRLSRSKDGIWIVKDAEGLSRLSLISPDPVIKPSLVIRPWHQAGNVISLREFSNNAFNQHHGMQSTERFGRDTDPDGDGIANELTRADITAVTLFQATLQVPGRVIPRDPEIEQAVLRGEGVFREIGCADCHMPSLPLRKSGWIFTEPNPFNPPLNLRTGECPPVKVDLTSRLLPEPRLTPKPGSGVIQVSAFTDFKLHDITSGARDPNAEPLDMNQNSWSSNFAAGNRRFLTRRLWDSGGGPPYYHHGAFTTMRQAVLAHSGEALRQRQAFEALPDYDKDSVIEFLKTMQVLPPGIRELTVDERYRGRDWPPNTQQTRR
jgi:hypothetical protein